MIRQRGMVAVALLVLVVSAGCMGVSSDPSDVGVETTSDGPAPGSTDSTDSPDSTDSTDSTTTADDPSEATGIDCPDDIDHYRGLAVEHVAEETGADPANVTVVNDAFVEYPILGECYYNAKVRNAESRDVLGAYIAENGTVVDREAVEARADAVYERKYGNLSQDLYERAQSADADERIRVVVTVEDINHTAAKQAVDRENLTDEEYKQALSAEYERRIDEKTTDVAGVLHEMETVSIGDLGSLRIEIRATSEAIEKIQRLDRVALLDVPPEQTTTYVSGTTASGDT